MGQAGAGFSRPERLQAFIRDLKAISEHFKTKFGVRLGLVFVDTVSASFDIKEEADNAEAARVCKAMRRFGDAIGALVVPIHHYGKNAGVGLRGASAWRANADFVLSVMADIDPQTGVVSNRGNWPSPRTANGAQGALTAFMLKPVDLGADELGQRWGSMVAVAEEASAAKPTSDWAAEPVPYRRALQTAFGRWRFRGQAFLGRSGPGALVFLHLVRDEFAKITHVDSASEEKRQEAIRKQFARKLSQAQAEEAAGVRKARRQDTGLGRSAGRSRSNEPPRTPRTRFFISLRKRGVRSESGAKKPNDFKGDFWPGHRPRPAVSGALGPLGDSLEDFVP